MKLNKTQELYLSFFYTIGFFFLISNLKNFMKYVWMDSFTPQWPASWISLQWSGPSISMIYVVFCLLIIPAILNPQNRLLRFLAFFAIFQDLSMIHHGGKIGHATHLLIYLSAILVLFDFNKPRNFNLFLATARTLIIAIYTISGSWKLLALLKNNDFSQIYAGLYRFLPESLSSAYSVGETNTLSLAHFFTEHPNLSSTIAACAIAVEFFSFLALIFTRIQFYIGFVILFFHISILFFLGINFSMHAILVFYIFVLAAKLEKVDFKNAD
ncbi:MAG: hypothetical protein ACK5P7_02795 [Bdellovibrio sp.]